MTERSKVPSSVEPPAFPVGEDELRLVDLALAEDIGPGDWTTRWIIPARTRATGNIIANADGVLAGIAIVSAVFLRLDPRVEILTSCTDGDAISAGNLICTVKGAARVLLSGQRTALNFLQRLSGIASLTRKYVDAVAGTGVTVLDSRKTTAGWRTLERSAVRSGGGQNHRSGLHEMIVIEASHIDIAGGVQQAMARVKDANQRGLRVSVAVRNKDELKSALEAGCDRILVDNTDVQFIREIVRVARKHSPNIEVEASGNMSIDRMRAVAETEVNFISVGALTHSAPALDFELQIVP